MSEDAWSSMNRSARKAQIKRWCKPEIEVGVTNLGVGFFFGICISAECKQQNNFLKKKEIICNLILFDLVALTSKCKERGRAPKSKKKKKLHVNEANSVLCFLSNFYTCICRTRDTAILDTFSTQTLPRLSAQLINYTKSRHHTTLHVYVSQQPLKHSVSQTNTTEKDSIFFFLVCTAMRPLPRRTRAKRKRTTPSPTAHRRPRVGDIIDVYWDDRNVYYRGKLVKRWPKASFGFYIRYDDGDYISTNLDHYSWHFALPAVDMWRQCCARATDFCPGQLDDIWDLPTRISEHGAGAHFADNHSSAELDPARTEARIQPPAHERDEKVLKADQPTVSLTRLPTAVTNEVVCDHSSVSSSKQADDSLQKSFQSNAAGYPTREDMEQQEGEEEKEEEMEGEEGEALSAVATSQTPVNLSQIASSAESTPVQTEGSSRDVGPSSAVPNSTTVSCQSLTTAEGLCLLENAQQPNEGAELKSKGDMNPAVDSSLLRRNVSQAGMSSDAHWKRRIRSRYLYESK